MPEDGSIKMEDGRDMDILYQDEYYIGVYKPPGLLVHRSTVDAHERRFCVQLLRDQVGQPVYPCHRLDKPTSGALLFALSRDALRAANEAFAAGRVEKRYRAVVRGWIRESGCLDYPLSPERDPRRDRLPAAPQSAVTAYFPVDHFEWKQPHGPHATVRASLVELSPRTGRTHQLRRHMAHLRHPIIGDTRHGDGWHNRHFRERFACHRLLLTATGLRLRHPFLEEVLALECPPDAAFCAVLEAMRTC